MVNEREAQKVRAATGGTKKIATQRTRNMGDCVHPTTMTIWLRWTLAPGDLPPLVSKRRPTGRRRLLVCHSVAQEKYPLNGQRHPPLAHAGQRVIDEYLSAKDVDDRRHPVDISRVDHHA